MNDPGSVLHLTTDRSTFDAVESILEDERSEIEVSAATSVEHAHSILEDGQINCAVVDSTLARRADRNLVVKLRAARHCTGQDGRVEREVDVESEGNRIRTGQ